ncbi:hypothetical protein [Aliarcobacter butzleri]|nr:hypothetical protein [Aliarcobacter butzleri]MCT7606843.1 hypothetical protein [Aliarcobacter butzleri]MCT7646378.1 hypothetical protein [Aliarcobacter butzleri]
MENINSTLEEYFQALEATKQRRRVKFISAEDLTNELIAANHSNTITD